MSYWISLVNGEIVCKEEGGAEWSPTLEVEQHREGGTYAASGTTEASLNVTYNYARHFRFRDLDRRFARDTIPEMEEAVAKLGTDLDPDYWAPTAGNAGYAVSVLLGWARQHPEGIWRVN